MTPEEQKTWKQTHRRKAEQFIRNQIAISEQQYGPFADPTRCERLEDIRRNIKNSARAYWKIMADPVDEERFLLSMEVFDEIVDEIKHLTVN